jgi:hypothetical protein
MVKGSLEWPGHSGGGHSGALLNGEEDGVVRAAHMGRDGAN